MPRRIDPAHLKREQVKCSLPEGGVALAIAAAQRAEIVFKSGAGNPSAFLAALLRVVVTNDGEEACSLSWRYRDRQGDAKAFKVLVDTVSRPQQLARVPNPTWEGLLRAVDEARRLRTAVAKSD
jgi:hypothetical protein